MSKITKIQNRASELSDELDQIVMDMQEAFDNHSERWQESDAASEMEEKIDTLTEWRDNLSDIAEAEL